MFLLSTATPPRVTDSFYIGEHRATLKRKAAPIRNMPLYSSGLAVWGKKIKYLIAHIQSVFRDTPMRLFYGMEGINMNGCSKYLLYYYSTQSIPKNKLTVRCPKLPFSGLIKPAQPWTLWNLRGGILRQGKQRRRRKKRFGSWGRANNIRIWIPSVFFQIIRIYRSQNKSVGRNCRINISVLWRGPPTGGASWRL